MSTPPREARGFLPRLPPEYYRGRAVVLWTHTLHKRSTGWLNERFHDAFREGMLHAAIREDLVCPTYVLMPDHLHVVWMGVSSDSDQRLASAFLRTQLEAVMGKFQFQHQPHDRLLREEERKRNASGATCSYVLENPVRASLVQTANLWEFSGCVVPGYPSLHPAAPDFWGKFWRIYNGTVARNRVGKIPTAS